MATLLTSHNSGHFGDPHNLSHFSHSSNVIPVVRHRPKQNRVTWETPNSEAIPLLQEPIGVLASYTTHAQTQV